jgi:hypothetical protein
MPTRVIDILGKVPSKISDGNDSGSAHCTVELHSRAEIALVSKFFSYASADGPLTTPTLIQEWEPCRVLVELLGARRWSRSLTSAGRTIGAVMVDQSCGGCAPSWLTDGARNLGKRFWSIENGVFMNREIPGGASDIGVDIGFLD